MKDIIFVTSNDNKMREAEAILSVDLKRRKLDLEEIQSMDLKEIVSYKVRQAYKKVRKPVIAEDTGLYVTAWNGFPGPFIKWVKDVVGYDVFPRSVVGSDRSVVWRTTYAYFDGRQLRTFEGKSEGILAKRQRGTDGWGFDVLFIPKGERKTLAELGPDKKGKYSARYKALRKLKKYLHQK